MSFDRDIDLNCPFCDTTAFASRPASDGNAAILLAVARLNAHIVTKHLEHNHLVIQIHESMNIPLRVAKHGIVDKDGFRVSQQRIVDFINEVTQCLIRPTAS